MVFYLFKKIMKFSMINLSVIKGYCRDYYLSDIEHVINTMDILFTKV